MQTKVDYQKYLASREWRLKRKEVIERADNICERCFSADIANVHHLTYERLGKEDARNDLLGVCRPCHEYLSAKRDQDPAVTIIWGLIANHGLTPEFIHEAHPEYFGILSWETGPTLKDAWFHCDFKPTPEYTPLENEVGIVVQLGANLWLHCASY